MRSKIKTGFNFKIVVYIQGGLLVIESLFFLLCAAVALYYSEQTVTYFGI